MMSSEFKILGCGAAGWSDITGEYLEEVGSGATVVLTGGHLTISMPVGEDRDDFFEAERLLMHLVTEAMELLSSRRAQHEIDRVDKYHDKCRRKLEKVLPTLSEASARDIMSLIVADALPVGEASFRKKGLLEIINHHLGQTSAELA